VLPEVVIEEQVATLPGLDGRKMSKSYDNTIPLFAGGQKHLRDSIMRIVTDSRLPGEAKDPDSSSLFTIFRAFATEAEAGAFHQALLDGIGWGEAKQVLFERIEADVAPMRERYDELMARPERIEAILREGALKARAIAAPKIAALRDAIGLRSGALVAAAPAPAVGKAEGRAGKLPRFASFREADGSFRFRLFSAEGEELLLSKSFADPKAAGAWQKKLKGPGAIAAVLQVQPRALHLELDGEFVGSTPEYGDEPARDGALTRLREALDQLSAQE